MRYKKTESTNILANFPSGGSITVDVYKLSDNSLVVTSGVMNQVATTGIYSYSFSQSITGEKEEYLWIATDTLSSKIGKVVLGGYVDTILKTSDFIALS